MRIPIKKNKKNCRGSMSNSVPIRIHQIRLPPPNTRHTKHTDTSSPPSLSHSLQGRQNESLFSMFFDPLHHFLLPDPILPNHFSIHPTSPPSATHTHTITYALSHHKGKVHHGLKQPAFQKVRFAYKVFSAIRHISSGVKILAER